MTTLTITETDVYLSLLLVFRLNIFLKYFFYENLISFRLYDKGKYYKYYFEKGTNPKLNK